jgi:hypothetical protein
VSPAALDHVSWRPTDPVVPPAVPATVPDRRGVAPGLELRCSEVHPVQCDVALRGSSPDDLTARACDHGASAHGFTPVWYTRHRIAAIAAAATASRIAP